ncbi:hypothetical protein GW916_02700 [bacterium]|nr:hypothetical protein [bacterium]
MRFLSLLSLLGLAIFVLFTSVGHADVFQEPSHQDESYTQEELETLDVSGTHVSGGQRFHRRQGHIGRRHFPVPNHQPPVILPPTHRHPGTGYGRPACNIFFVGYNFGNPVYNLFVGNRLMQTAYYGVVVNSAYYYARLGYCYLGNVR